MSQLSSTLLALGLNFAAPDVDSNLSLKACGALAETTEVNQKDIEYVRFVNPSNNTPHAYITAVREQIFNLNNGVLTLNCLYGKKVRNNKPSDEKWTSNNAGEELLEVTVMDFRRGKNATFKDGDGPFSYPDGVADVVDSGDGDGQRSVGRQLPEKQEEFRLQFSATIKSILGNMKKGK